MKNSILTNLKIIIVVIVILTGSFIMIERKEHSNIPVKVEPNKKNEIEVLLEDNKAKIEFYANAYKIDNVKLNELLKTYYKEIGLLNNKESFDLILINYLFDLEIKNKYLFDNTIEDNKKNKEYILTILEYFTNIYPNVNYTIAASIAEVESNFTSEYMLKCNNIFGGISKGKLLKYKTIEYGILKYVKLLNDRYFEKGLNTIETIGKVYNPIITDSGEKIANPKWVSNVKISK